MSDDLFHQLFDLAVGGVFAVAGFAPFFVPGIAAAAVTPPAGSAAPAAPEPPPDPAAASRVAAIQSALRESGIDGWLFFDFRESNPIASRILMIPEGAIATRRWFYFIPANGQPVRIVHAIEEGRLDHLPGAKRVYASWVTLQTEVRIAL
jgi:hypothetical protein